MSPRANYAANQWKRKEKIYEKLVLALKNDASYRTHRDRKILKKVQNAKRFVESH